MCGRFALNATLNDLLAALKIKGHLNLTARYNIAPGDRIVAMRNHPEKVGRELAWLEWGLVPSWMKERPTTATLINARAETVGEKPSFRDAYRMRRCLIPASGFYEWKAELTYKQPFYIYLKDTPVFAFAGIWERWKAPHGEALQTAAILTAEANPSIRPLHHRMPVAVAPDDHDGWLSGALAAGEAAARAEKVRFAYHPVSRKVNSTANDDPSLIEEMKPESPGQLL